MKNIESISTNWLNWTKEDWSDWLKEKKKERRQVFIISPDELIGSFNREKSHARDYHGRELLELIQNADDSGIGYSKPNKLLVRLTESGLLITNTGVPFSPEGVSSLMVSDNSPKQLLRTKCIGYKGLGFRSVLGWASSIVILSGKLSIGFNEKIAAQWLQDLREESPKVDEKVRKFENSGILNPIATLSVPFLLSHDNTIGEEINTMYAEGKKICESGYDTAICVLFKDPDKTRKQMQNQINSLGNEILLFLQYLERIEIQSPERNEYWLVERKENEVIVNPQEDNPNRWRIFKREGEIPKEYLKPEQILNDKYEIKLAIPTESIDVDKLFVFFPTEVRFPFPIIAHATFELGDNRQHLIDSDVNRFITKELADLMAESAERIKDVNNPWHAVSTISPRGDIDSVLEKFDFLGILEEKMRTYALLPVRNKRFETAEKSKRIRGNFDNLLTSELFNDICIYTEDYFIEEKLGRLGVNHIEYDDLRERLNKFSDILLLNQRVDLIYSLIENNLVKGEPPELLIDELGAKIPSKSSIFLPAEKKIFSLPSWVSQKILNSELTSALRGKFEVSRIRNLALRLEPFNVQEYNMNSLVSSIVAETNRRAKENPEKELELRQEMIQAIWSLYSAGEEKVKLREEINVILPTWSGNFESARNLYLGKEYKGGKILEYLYAHIDPGLFVSSPDKLGFAGNLNKEIEEFLCWLGVNRAPRYTKVDFRDGSFLDYVMSSLKYPAKFGDMTIENLDGLRECSHHYLQNVLYVDRLKEVLTTADPHAIICWIATNPDVEFWRISGDENAIFEIRKSYQHSGRKLLNQSISSYPLWLLKNTVWLPTSNGDKLSPSKCSLVRVAKDLSPIIGFPAVNKDHPLIKELNLDRTAISNVLIKIGLVTDLDELPWDSFYEILLELANLDPEGNKAKSLYRMLIGRSDIDISPSGEKYKEFMTDGKMLGRIREVVKYYPINKLYYIENITLPNNIAEQYPLLELDRRRGASKVKKLFGVDQLTRDKIQIEITKFEEHPCSQNFQNEIERLKAYIYALRVEEDTNRVELRALKKLKINLCRSVRVAILVDKETKEIELKEGDSINIDSQAYLVAEPSDYTCPFLEDEIIADAIGEIISNILKVDVGNKIAFIASCSSSKRDLLLNRIVGGSGIERMNKTKELFRSPIDKEEEFSIPLPWEPPVEKSETEKAPVGEDLTRDKTKESEVGPVLIIDKGTPTPLIKRVIVRKLQLNPKTNGSSHSKKKVNPDRAENLARRYEEAQERYSIPISFIRGLESYGCDIISFKSENDFNSFKETQDPALIDRFIEVKGSSSEKGSFTLKGNQLRSAQTYKEKFFIYRIYENEENGTFELVEINDPLASEKEALEMHYEINPFRSSRSHLWGVEETDIS